MHPSAEEKATIAAPESGVKPPSGERRRRRKRNTSREAQRRLRQVKKLVWVLFLVVVGTILAAGTALYLGR